MAIEEVEAGAKAAKAEQNPLLPDNVRVMPLKQVMAQVARTGLPFGISTAAAGNTLLISLLLAQISPTAVAAGPFIAALQNFSIGICRASLLANSLSIGPINGSAKTDADFNKIGKVLRQGWILAAFLAGGSSLILAFSGKILNAIGIDAAVASETQSYFNWYIAGSFPLLHSFADQQLAVGMANPWLPTLRGPIYGGMIFGFSYLALQGLFGEQFKGIAGIGLGSAIAAWAIFALTKLTHLLPSMRKYGLYNFDFSGGWEIFKNLCSLSAKLGFQVATEWINLLGLSIIIGRMGLDAVHAMQPSIQLLTMSGLFSLGFSAGIGALCANALGIMKTARGNLVSQSHANKNFMCLGHVGVIGGMLLQTLLAVVMVAAPQMFTNSMLHKEITEDVLATSDLAIRISALSLFFDAFRIVSAGPLRAFRDINFVTFFSFLIMSILGLPAEGVAGPVVGSGVDTFSWIRSATITIPALLVFARWMTSANTKPEQKVALEQLHSESGWSRAALFAPVRKVTHADAAPLSVQEGTTFTV